MVRIYLVLLLLLGTSLVQAQELALVRENKLFGYLNKEGEYAIAPKYVGANSFAEDLACVSDGVLWGYIDRQGNWVVKPTFDEAKDFNSGLALVKVDKDWFYIDKKGKRLNLDPTIDARQYRFYKGASIYRVEKKVGLIDSQGTIVLTPKYDVIKRFTTDYTPVALDKRWGIIDYQGKEIIAPIYQSVGKYENGLTWVKQEGQLFLWREGTLVAIPFVDDVINSTNPDFIIVKQGKKFGIINDKGEVVLPLKYDNLGPLNEGMIAARQNGYWGYIDEKGAQKIAFTFENALSFTEDGLAGVKLQEWGFIDKTGKIVIPAQYKINAHLFAPQAKNKGFYEGLIRVKYNKKWGFLDVNGNLFTGKWYKNVELYN